MISTDVVIVLPPDVDWQREVDGRDDALATALLRRFVGEPKTAGSVFANFAPPES